jgi:hypothetical protein
MNKLLDLLNQKNDEEEQLYTPSSSIVPVRGPEGTMDSLRNVDNAELGKAGQSLGLPIDPTSIPLVSGLTNDELAQEQAVAPKVDAVSNIASAPSPSSVNRSPAVVPNTKKPDAPKELSPIERLESKLSELHDQRKKEMEAADSRQWKADLVAGLSQRIGQLTAGAQAMNTHAAVTPAQMPKIEVGDLTAKVEKKYKPEMDQLLAQYKALRKQDEPMTQYQREMLDIMKHGQVLQGNRLDANKDHFNRSLDFRQGTQNYIRLNNAQQAYNKDKVVQKSEERISAAQSMRELLASKNPISDEAAKRFAARASGEVGAMTDNDIKPFGGRQSLVGRIQQAAEQAKSGSLTDENRKLLMDLSQKFESSAKAQLHNRLDVYAKQAADDLGLTPMELKTRIRPDLAEEIGKQPIEEAPANTVERTTKDGRTAIFDATTKQFLKYKD